jgi:hypothetical protein
MSMYVWWKNGGKSVLVYTFEGEWTLTDIANSLENRPLLLESVPHQVITIIDLKDCFALPDDLLCFATRLASQHHHQLDITFVVSPGPLIEMSRTIMQKIDQNLGGSVRFVKTVDDTYFYVTANNLATTLREFSQQVLQ